jgi:hypothetical protein
MKMKIKENLITSTNDDQHEIHIVTYVTGGWDILRSKKIKLKRAQLKSNKSSDSSPRKAPGIGLFSTQ